MEISVTQQQGRVPVSIVQVEGDLDAQTYAEFEAHTRAAVEAGARHMAVDLSRVRFMSSAGIRALHKTFMLLRAQAAEADNEAMLAGLRDGTFKSAHLKLVGPNQDVRSVLATTGLDMYLEVVPDVETAVGSF
jgi:anti-anti-sigma factor